MKAILFLSVAIVCFFVGYLLLSPHSEVNNMIIDPSTASYQHPESRGGTQEDTTYPHYVSAAFGIFAGFLLVKKSENTVITLFSIAVLSTIFGRYLGDLVIPDFLLNL